VTQNYRALDRGSQLPLSDVFESGFLFGVSRMNKMLVKSLMTLVASSFMFVALTFAWFVVSTNNNVDPIVINISPLDFEYTLYLFKDESGTGASTQVLSQSLCLHEEDNNCYFPHESSNPYLFPSSVGFRPGQKFSFALQITNISAGSRYANVTISEVSSLGFQSIQNKIQRAFLYQVTKMVYDTPLGESSDQKGLLGVMYAGMDSEADYHFSLNSEDAYSLFSGFPLYPQVDTKSVIVYFNLYFDPSVYGMDESMQLSNNSNAFQNQQLIIRKVTITPFVLVDEDD
jgi:hypothetical protein